MTVILQMANKIQFVIDNIEEIIRQEAIEHREFIKLLNRVQLRAGEKADGSEMPNYVPKSKQPQAPGAIQLFDTGAFQEGIEPLFEKSGLFMVGLEEKTPILVKKYGKILGLTEESQQRLVERMTPGLIKRIQKLLK